MGKPVRNAVSGPPPGLPIRIRILQDPRVSWVLAQVGEALAQGALGSPHLLKSSRALLHAWSARRRMLRMSSFPQRWVTPQLAVCSSRAESLSLLAGFPAPRRCPAKPGRSLAEWWMNGRVEAGVSLTDSLLLSVPTSQMQCLPLITESQAWLCFL